MLAEAIVLMCESLFDLQISEYLVAQRSDFFWLKSQVVERGLLDNIFQRGIERGEIDTTRITPRIASLLGDLVRHEVMMDA